MRSITNIVRHFKQNWTEELNQTNIANACRDSGMTWLGSMLNPVVTVQIFLLQVLHGNTACQHMPRLCEMAFTAAGYCKARMRVKLEVFELLLSRCVDSLQKDTLDAGRWFGHRVFMVDGSSFSMPDTPALQSHFGQHTLQKPGCGFPTAHWLAMLHMAVGRQQHRQDRQTVRQSNASKQIRTTSQETQTQDLRLDDQAKKRTQESPGRAMT